MVLVQGLLCKTIAHTQTLCLMTNFDKSQKQTSGQWSDRHIYVTAKFACSCGLFAIELVVVTACDK